MAAIAECLLGDPKRVREHIASLFSTVWATGLALLTWSATRSSAVLRLLPALLLVSSQSLAHEVGAPFSGAIIDPIEVHHAHLEDEQRLNLFYLRADERGSDRGEIFGTSVELAWNWNDSFRWGTEIIVPFLNAGVNSSFELGDIELQPVKYAFINTPQRIATVVLGARLPTGDEDRGLGEGTFAIEPHLFLDQAIGNWFLGLNAVPGFTVTGDHETSFEFGGVVAYSFIRGTADLAETRPEQRLVPAVSIEFLAERILAGDEQGEEEASSLIGLSLWNPGSGWALRMGLEIPLNHDSEADVVWHLQIGNHLRWRPLKTGGDH